MPTVSRLANSGTAPLNKHPQENVTVIACAGLQCVIEILSLNVVLFICHAAWYSWMKETFKSGTVDKRTSIRIKKKAYER